MPKQIHDGAPRLADDNRPETRADRVEMKDQLQMNRRSLVTTFGMIAAAGAISAPMASHAAQAVALPEGAVTVVASLRARDGKEAELVRATSTLVPKVRQEAGNLLCQFHQGLEEPGLFVFYEIFESTAALEAHKQTLHVNEWSTTVASLTEGPVELKLLRALA
ncbi:antibiotic biosynthesis monooxygenase [Ensifer sp. MPMI2T]|nr:antibiotic biosynthesis monooxygenase [Ensifer sp. MPMI2T]